MGVGYPRLNGTKGMLYRFPSRLHPIRLCLQVYEAAGFVLANEEKHESFGKKLVGQTWRLKLDTTP